VENQQQEAAFQRKDKIGKSSQGTDRKANEDNIESAIELNTVIEGRNAVLEAYRAQRTVDKIFLLDGSNDGPMTAIKREAKKQHSLMKFVTKERLDEISKTGKHQGVIAYCAAYAYHEIEDMLRIAEEKGEPPFLILLDSIEDPHNLGAVIRTADIVGAHGVIIPKNRAVGLTATVAKASAGAISYVPVAKVTNLGQTIDELKKKGLWFVCADTDGTPMYDLDLRGAIGLVIGGEGEGVGRLLREKCDMIATIPMKGHISSLNASVAAGVLSYEIVRRRLGK
jgi:23S rRNA (guanosine2251-2'-O)-methyltransferase